MGVVQNTLQPILRLKRMRPMDSRVPLVPCGFMVRHRSQAGERVYITRLSDR